MNNKAILMSIQPRWVVEILNGNKTIEVRKKFPKDYVGWVYIYCTKNRLPLMRCSNGKWFVKDKNYDYDMRFCYYAGYNGKVVARFWCDKVEHFEFETISRDIDGYWWDNGKMVEHSFITKQCCLTTESFTKYIEYGGGYAIHISRLEVFDKPKELKEFKHTKVYRKCEECPYGNPCVTCFSCEEIVNLEKAPQSYMFIEGE